MESLKSLSTCFRTVSGVFKSTFSGSATAKHDDFARPAVSFFRQKFVKSKFSLLKLHHVCYLMLLSAISYYSSISNSLKKICKKLLAIRCFILNLQLRVSVPVLAATSCRKHFLVHTFLLITSNSLFTMATSDSIN
jgi:hypothetical protein